MNQGIDDTQVARLATLFFEHPAWVAAARHLSVKATSNVWFRHLPGVPFRLEQQGGRSRLLAGASTDPDLVFCFTPGAIERLVATEGGIGDFAVALFELILDDDPELAVGFRVAAPFSRLVLRGYARLLLAAGPRVAAFGASHGIRNLAGLRRLVSNLRRSEPAAWELCERPERA